MGYLYMHLLLFDRKIAVRWFINRAADERRGWNRPAAGAPGFVSSTLHHITLSVARSSHVVAPVIVVDTPDLAAYCDAGRRFCAIRLGLSSSDVGMYKQKKELL